MLGAQLAQDLEKAVDGLGQLTDVGKIAAMTGAASKE
jgi:hypothetical protein